MNQAEKCQKCLKIPEDILMLACGHDLCLPCAAEVFSTQSVGLPTQKDFVCDECSTHTELDATSVYELEKIQIQQTLAKRKNSHSEVNQSRVLQSTQKHLTQSKFQTELKTDPRLSVDLKAINKTDKENLKYKTQTFLTSSIRNGPTLNGMPREWSQGSIQHARGSCQDHPEEEVSYFCFDCQTNCICPECIIHGIHKNHEVQTVKKAYPVVKQIVGEIHEANTEFQNLINQQRQEIDFRQSQQDEFVQQLSSQIKKEFLTLHQELHNKEDEILQSITRIPSVVDQYRDFLKVLQNSESKLQTLNSKIEQHLEAKEEISLLNFYASISKQEMPQTMNIPPLQELVTNQSDIMETMHDLRSRVEQLVFYCNEQNDQRAYSPKREKTITGRKSVERKKFAYLV